MHTIEVPITIFDYYFYNVSMYILKLKNVDYLDFHWIDNGEKKMKRIYIKISSFWFQRRTKVDRFGTT